MAKLICQEANILARLFMPKIQSIFWIGMLIIATSKIAVTLDNCSKKWYNMSQGDEKNGQNAAQCVAESSCWTTRTNNTYHAAGIELRYLPPYSPDMNPIEMLWSKVKALLRKWECRTAELLPKTVSCALLCVSQRDCVGWFKAEGYCL